MSRHFPSRLIRLALGLGLAAAASAQSPGPFAYGMVHAPAAELARLKGYGTRVIFAAPGRTAADWRTFLAEADKQGLDVIATTAGGGLRHPQGGLNLAWAEARYRTIFYGHPDIQNHRRLKGHFILDEPGDPTNWGGRILTRSELHALYLLARKYAPRVPAFVGVGALVVLKNYLPIDKGSNAIADGVTFTYTEKKDRIFGGLARFFTAELPYLRSARRGYPDLQAILMIQSWGDPARSKTMNTVPWIEAAGLATAARTAELGGMLYYSWRNNKFAETLGTVVDREEKSPGPKPYRDMIIRLGRSFRPPSLTPSATTYSLAAGGHVDLELQAGRLRAGGLAVHGASLSGRAPGFSLAGLHVPLNPDALTWASLALANTPLFTGFVATLNSEGAWTARFNPGAGPHDPRLAGTTLTFAAAVFQGGLPTATSQAAGVALVR